MVNLAEFHFQLRKSGFTNLWLCVIVATSLPNDFVLEWVHMIDTGGQPELMEVVPSLIHTIVLVDLRYGLNEHSQVD